MIKKIGLSLLTVSLLSSGLFAKADKTLVDKYMDVSGANITIESISSQITSGIQQSSMMYGETVDEKEIQFLEKAFDGDKGIEVVEAYLVEHFDNDSVKKLITYYQTPTGKKITQASIDAMQPEAQSEMLRFMADISSNPPSPERVKTIKAFIAQLDLVQTVEDMFTEILLFINEEVSADKKFTPLKIDEMKEMMDQAFQQQMFISSLYMYKDISNEELNKAIAFYKTAAGQDELQIVRDAMSKMLKSGFSRALNSK